jgi:hypothetical protein
VKPVPTHLLLQVALAAVPAYAKVLAEVKRKNGFYLQKIENKDRAVRLDCRATGDAKFQKDASCESAGAVKP